MREKHTKRTRSFKMWDRMPSAIIYFILMILKQEERGHHKKSKRARYRGIKKFQCLQRHVRLNLNAMGCRMVSWCMSLAVMGPPDALHTIAPWKEEKKCTAAVKRRGLTDPVYPRVYYCYCSHARCIPHHLLILTHQTNYSYVISHFLYSFDTTRCLSLFGFVGLLCSGSVRNEDNPHFQLLNSREFDDRNIKYIKTLFGREVRNFLFKIIELLGYSCSLENT